MHHNHGRGLWADTNHDGAIWDGNPVEDNDWDGLVDEISYSATITNSVVNRNGAGNPSTYEGAGIAIHASGGTGITVTGNTLSGNKNGIILIQASRGSGSLGSYTVQNVSVHDNTVTLGLTKIMVRFSTAATPDSGQRSTTTSLTTRTICRQPTQRRSNGPPQGKPLQRR